MVLSNCFLVEDHHKVLSVWRKKNANNCDLIHIDAHLDFDFYSTKSPLQAINEARTIKELKTSLEKSLLFRRFEKDFNKQTDIGNYIYPAMYEGIIRDFYWVIPGRLKEFKESHKQLKIIIKNLSRQDPYKTAYHFKPSNKKSYNSSITTNLLGRKFVICTLESLPVFKHKVLLDIDTDFLIVDRLKNANNFSMIGKRKPWLSPKELTSYLKNKVSSPLLTTIAYSVNGGFTPMKYKHLGDEIAYCLSPRNFQKRLQRFSLAAKYFNLFESSGRKEYYKKAIELNPKYRAQYNNYGPLYLNCRKFSKAKKEFERIIPIDPTNPYPYIGLGEIFLHRRKYHAAKRCFGYALKQKRNLSQAILGLAQAEFRLRNFSKAKSLFLKYIKLNPLQAQGSYFLGRICEMQREFGNAVNYYKDAIKLGLNHIDLIKKLLKLSKYIKEKESVIKYAIARFKDLKKAFSAIKRASRKNKRSLRRVLKIETEMKELEAMF